ncbi:diaminopimelate epimerase [Tepidibacter formicigenes]|uniref:diaminopimelate epimerase n=1 Tax=Tepidibacter formicigenes TaxID=227138 RepID=UPI00093341A3
MKFWKMHGVGNDFIALDGERYDIKDYSEFAKKICHRHFGVGADGLLVAKKSDKADCEMIYYNSDGSRAKMCGNGLRCFSKFVYDKKIVDKDTFKVETLDGVKDIKLNLNSGKIESIKINMGKANFNPKSVPVKTDKDIFINEDIFVIDKDFKVSSLLVGVPHTIVFVDEIDKKEILKYGPEIEKSSIFPEKTNVNFVKIVDKENILVSTWERGCGYTLACGTGICASSAMAHYLNKISNKVKVKSEGGELLIEIIDEYIYMQGSAVKICEGILEV